MSIHTAGFRFSKLLGLLPTHRLSNYLPGSPLTISFSFFENGASQCLPVESSSGGDRRFAK